MTVSTNKARETFTGDGSQTVFPVSFRIFKEGDVEVVVGGVTQVLDTDYEVNNITDSDFDVDFGISSAPASGDTIIVRRDIEIVQETDYREADPFPAASHEDALDLLTMIAQQARESTDRALKIQSAEASIGTLPLKADRRNKFLKFKDTTDADPEAVEISSLGSGLVLDENDFSSNSADDAPSQQSVWESILPVDNVKAYGAVGDGATDDTTAVQNAIDASDRPTVFPPGDYKITSQITLPVGARLIGASGSPNRLRNTGVWILITDTGSPAFSFDRDITVENIGFDYPDQVDSATPITYPATFSADTTSETSGIQFNEVATARGTVFFEIANASDGTGAGRAWFNDCRLHALNTAIDVESATEILSVSNCMFGTGVLLQLISSTLPALDTYTRENATAVRVGEGTFAMYDSFVFGCNRGLHCDRGTLQEGIFNSFFDQVLNPVIFRADGVPVSFTVSGCNFFVQDTQDTTRVSLGAIQVATTDAAAPAPRLNISGCICRRGRFLRIVTNTAAIGGRYVVSACMILRPGHSQTSGTHQAFLLNDSGADVVLTGVESALFESSDSGTTKHFISVTNVNHLTVTGCAADDLSRFVDLTAGTSVTLAGNQVSNVSVGTADNVSNASGEIINDPHQWGAKASGNSTRPAFKAKNNATQTVSAGPDNVVLGAEDFDKGSDFASNTFTAPVAGLYFFAGAATTTASATAGDVFDLLLTDGTIVMRVRAEMTGVLQTLHVQGVYELAQGDTVNMQIERVSGSGDFDIPANGTLTYLTGHLLSG